MNTGPFRRTVAAIATAAVFAAGLVVAVGAAPAASAASGPAPIEQRNAQTVTADPLPTVQIDSGIVWAQVVNGDTVYAGGSFSNARPAGAAAGTNLMPRSNILAYNINTGVATSFAPVINGTVKSLAVSPDGTRLYVGGSFSQVDGQTRWNLAAFDTATGTLVSSFKPAIGGSYVNAIVATNSTVYVGGLIGAAAGVTRKNLAAVSSTGALLAWAPTTDLQVDSMVMNHSGDKVIIAGRFENVNGTTSRGLGALDPTTGALLPFAVTNTVKNGLATGTLAGKAGIWSITTDANDVVYGTAWVFSNVTVGNLEGMFAADGETGNIVWIADCHGDHYGIYSDGTNVYSTGHEHDCSTAGGYPQANPAPGNMRNATAYTAAAKGTLLRSPSTGSIYSDWSGYPAPAAINWYPDWTTGTASGSGQAGWTATGNGKYLLIGGEFPYVNGQRSQGIARFTQNPPGGAKQGPMVSGTDWTPAGNSVSAGTARVQFPANWDRDDLVLNYELWEQGGSAPLATSTAKSSFWNRPTQTLTARGFAAGSTHTFYVVAKDGDGNSAKSAPITITISTATPSPYADAVLTDGASLYWRLGGTNTAGGTDWAGTNNAIWQSGTGTSTDTALSGETNGSTTFNGTSNGYGTSTSTVSPGYNFAVETWFKTSTTQGGKLIGFGSSATGNSSSYDRHLYMSNNGRLTFGVYPGGVKTVQSSASYNDNKWHYAVGQLSPAGLQLYVDGQLVGSDPTTTSAQDYTGYWRIGGDNLGGWPNGPSSSYFNGKMDEFAAYPSALTAQQIASHYAIGVGTGTPTAAFTPSGSNLNWSFDASASTAPSGRTISSYAWNFGDGQTGTGVQPTHAYAAGGTYTVSLTVTDSAGLTATTTNTIVATAPHLPPTAVIGSNTLGLTATFDGTSSTATAGSTVSSYAWDFGDGQTGTGAAPSHTYGAAGTYTVKLTVTDSLGSSSTPATAQVTVTHADPQAAFTPNTAGLTATVDASASTAADGATLSYSWNWGDGSAASTGVTAGHVYAAGGTYTVTLTATDSLGGTATVSQSVTVAAQTFAARDDFERTVASGWGSAPVGGAWTTTSGASVSGGKGVITMSPSQTKTATLGTVAVKDVDASVVYSSDTLANGGGQHFNLVVHKSSAGEYRAKVRIQSTGVVAVSIAKLVGTTETLLVNKNLTGFTYTPGTALHVHLTTSTTGGVTTLKTNVWPDGTAEPSGWFLTTTDSTTGLQDAGSVGVLTYLAGTVTNGPVTVSVDDLAVIDPNAATPPQHSAPVAVIGSQAQGLTVAFDGTGSQVSGGAAITSYAWSFGDGQTSTAAKPSHAYAQAGTYTATLTVTDNFGSTSAVASSTVTVTHAAPAAAFTTSVSGVNTSVDASGSTTSDGATASYSWNWGDGSAAGSGATTSHTYAASGTYTVTLTVTDSLGAQSTVSHDVTVSTDVFIAQDDFGRTVASGWGNAVTGGAWGTTAGFSVANGVGNISLAAGQTRSNALTSVSAQDVDARLAFSADKVADGGGLQFNYLVHKTAAGDYRLKLRFASTGAVTVSIAKMVGTTETQLSSRAIGSYTFTAGAKLQLRLQTVTVNGTTTLQAKVWDATTTEPSAWFVTATDTQAELQTAGQVGVLAYLSGSTTVAPVTVKVDDLQVR
ncbi:MAG: PKD domain-containing protein [Microbacterium sp.]|uniref:PKD domain-containing protein n=2 Tax=Microbacterium sp. TaxID=51671 RepID=UPI001ACC006A|nr:PKD domain-containing protein [Microbacterium sp.]MBN9155506.1 PKD domain-containing protein [Microbacterium sp.]